jgi:AbiV family abortive infection protein
MNGTQKKRQYRNTLNFVEAGFRACWRNASDLSAASKNLIDQGLHAPALSLAILALEEIGKMCAIDGLLFARSDDHKAQKFGKSQRDHGSKLAALPLLPFLIRNLSLVDPRREGDPAFVQALAIGLDHLQADEDAVLQTLREDGFAGLNRWKQQGLYVGIEKNAFVVPRAAINRKFAETVQHFTWRAVTTFDFVLGNGNLDRYIEQARSLRGKLGEDDHVSFEQVGRQIADELFCPAPDTAVGQSVN